MDTAADHKTPDNPLLKVQPRDSTPKRSLRESIDEHWGKFCAAILILGILLMATTLVSVGIGLVVLAVLTYLVKTLPGGIKRWVWEMQGLGEIKKIKSQESKNP